MPSSRYSLFMAASSLVVAMLTGGCGHYAGVPIARPADTFKPMRVAYQGNQSQLIDDRYLLVPVALDEPGKMLFSATPMLCSGSWSGFWGDNRSWTINLLVVDVRDHASHWLFEHPAAVGSLGLSFAPAECPTSRPMNESACFIEKRALASSGLLIISARTGDTNHDGQIDGQDSVALYSYDLAAAGLKQVSPEGYNVIRAERKDDGIIMVLTADADRQRCSVFVYQPREGTGEFVVSDVVSPK